LEAQIYHTDSVVLFRNSQGDSGQGTLLHLTRNLAVFEVYNPYSLVQLSEVLQDLRILRGEVVYYRGRAVVSNLVSTGILLIVSASLIDPWSEFAGFSPGKGLREEVSRFVREWDVGHRLRPAYQLAVSNLRAFLGEVSRWLEQVETVARDLGTEPSPDQEVEFFADVETALAPKLDELVAAFEGEASQVPPEETMPHKAFARRELHPLTLCSPFVHRTYTKPLGYGGDYVMVNMMLQNRGQGANVYAKIVDAANLRAAPAAAHRNRVAMLVEVLRGEARRRANRGRHLRVLNVGCGPAAEVQQFIREEPLAAGCEFDLLDFSEETIGYARQKISEVKPKSTREPKLRFIHKSIHELLRDASKKPEDVAPCYDLIYCAGLFDYLQDRVCKRVMELFCRQVDAGGLVLVTNVHPRNPHRYNMEHILEWHLVYRNEQAMQGLVPAGETGHTRTDPTGVNVFLEVRKKVA
jgi:extracellular factor (EF) 3-hydroxypalmitic acid methyl ester biosynthesis protein